MEQIFANVNLPAVQGKFLASIQRILDIIAFIGSGLPTVSEQNFQSFELLYTFDPADNCRLNYDAAKKETEIWLLRSFLTDAIDCAGAFIEECHLSCRLYKLISVGGSPVLNNLRRVMEPAKKRLHKLGLPDKIEALETDFGIKNIFSKYILSLNRARNCLVHRQGIVSTQDVDESGKLKIIWRTHQIIGKDINTGNEFIVIKDKPMDGPSTVYLRTLDMERTFEVGNKIELTFDELFHCITTLFFFSQALIIAIDEYRNRINSSIA